MITLDVMNELAEAAPGYVEEAVVSTLANRSVEAPHVGSNRKGKQSFSIVGPLPRR